MRREPAFLDNCFSQFPRTQRLDAWSANPIEAPNPPLWLRVLAFIVPWGWIAVPFVLVVTVLSGCDASAEPIAVRSAREDAEAISSREWAGVVQCGPHATADWLDDKTMRCLKHQKEMDQ